MSEPGTSDPTPPGRTVMRRPHRKARTGCTLCKRRRVKCGEEKPQCANCQAHNAECVYEAVTSRRMTSKAAAQGPTPSIPGVPGTPMFTLEHMELLHHYTASTSLTLSSNAPAMQVWQDRVPRIALRTDYVLHALLAVSALHLSHLRPHARMSYWATGVKLYHGALSKAQLEMENVTEENCTAVYVFSTLTGFYSLAQNGELASRSEQTEDADDDEEDLLSWVFLFRGIKTLIMLPHLVILHQGELAPMFEQGLIRALKTRSCPTCDPESILELLRDIVTDPAEQVIYTDAIQHLQKSFHNVFGRSSEAVVETTDVFVWLFDVSEEYMDRLRRHEGPAVAIFICYSLLVSQLRGVWWAKGWGEWISARLRRGLPDLERSFSGRLMDLLTAAIDYQRRHDEDVTMTNQVTHPLTPGDSEYHAGS
ncbi:hypothetical protein KVR01_010262 [Diaporthe batatas]|uniref:uncharacterized protein n=1 Tax=Diaporthe batatas TaxID=748121 RepID=UPI001D037C7A|nr:uncharacterized protein KVR01_010262 [Diaporthe batatas]KAG8159625.1 hypothetical protein KVR01_010262 [Diaporthe batatas]